jgi:predicted membrane protein
VTVADQDGTQAPVNVRRNLLRPLAITLSVLLVVVLAAAAITATVFHVDVQNGIGSRTYVPQSAADVHHKYKLGIGDLTVDVGNVEFPAGETEIASRVGIGKLVITVPSDVAVRVNASAQIGEARVFDRRDDGRNAGVKVNGNGRRVLILDAKVGLGTVQVKRSIR